MNPAEEEAANKEPERPSAGAVAGSVDKLNEQLRVSADGLFRRELLMRIADAGGGLDGRFDFVLNIRD